MQKHKHIDIAACACFLLAFAALALAVWGAKQRSLADEYFTAAGEYMEAVNSNYTRCANELCDNVSDMQVSLAKLYASGSQNQTVLALEDIVKSSAASVSVMSRLPQSVAGAGELMTFLVRSGDYARCLSRRVLAGETLSEGDIAQLEGLYDACTELSGRLSSAVTGGGLAFALPEAGALYADDPAADGFFSGGDEAHDNAETVPEYPALIYDGPFSESTEKAVPHGLGDEAVTVEEAKKTAERLTGAALGPNGEICGKIPVYLFAGEENGVSVSAAVTKKGGRLLWFMRDTAREESAENTPMTSEAPEQTGEGSDLPDEEEYRALVEAGLEWLDSAGYESMTPTYTLFYNGAALISFVYELDGIKVYNDLVKVRVERESLRVTGADANNYLFSHRQRLLPRAIITEDDARALACKRLEADAVSLSVIPLSPMTEALCWELHGYCRGEEYAVYINALTGREEQIFKIISDGNGKAAV